jgi:trk system potassium uptake protein TrkA
LRIPGCVYSELEAEDVKIVILGCGRVGARLATELDASHDVTIIDWSANAFDRLGDEFEGETLEGNGIDVDVLKAAGTQQADVFLALTNGDNRNIMAGELAQLLGAGRVMVRVYDPVRCEVFSGAGLTTFSPTITAVERLHARLVGEEEG